MKQFFFLFMERKRTTPTSISFFFLLSICTPIFFSRTTTASGIPCLDTRCPMFARAGRDFQVQGCGGTYFSVSRQMHGLLHLVGPDSLRSWNSPIHESESLDENHTELKEKNGQGLVFGGKMEVSSMGWHRRLLGGPGSSPPRCTSKCGRCTPCRPVHVPVPPGTPVTAEYYPEAWRCKCGNKLYMP
ncbi:EPIDERMAL PATTERNING FACTOR-like protein 6 [Glycine max]|nr:EPIDERMAL PATTERNING FACTOR-like protein 6 [Glycine max]